MRIANLSGVRRSAQYDIRTTQYEFIKEAGNVCYNSDDYRAMDRGRGGWV